MRLSRADNSKSEEKMPVENKVITEVISCKYCSASQASGASNGNETAQSSVTMYSEEKVEIFFAGKTGRIKLSRAGHETDWRTFDELSPEALAVHAVFEEDLQKLDSNDEDSFFVLEEQKYQYFDPVQMEAGEKAYFNTKEFSKWELDFTKVHEKGINLLKTTVLEGDVWSQNYSSSGEVGGRGMIPNPALRWAYTDTEPFKYSNINQIRGGTF